MKPYELTNINLMKNKLKDLLRNRINYFAGFLLLGIFLFPQVSALAQERTITGTVTGVNNEPIVGATVTVQGTTLGALTGLDGRFTLSTKK